MTAVSLSAAAHVGMPRAREKSPAGDRCRRYQRPPRRTSRKTISSRMAPTVA
jgi:hypothetical protein